MFRIHSKATNHNLISPQMIVSYRLSCTPVDRCHRRQLSSSAPDIIQNSWTWFEPFYCILFKHNYVLKIVNISRKKIWIIHTYKTHTNVMLSHLLNNYYLMTDQTGNTEYNSVKWIAFLREIYAISPIHLSTFTKLMRIYGITNLSL